MSSSAPIEGYEQFKGALQRYGSDKRVFVLFSGAIDEHGHSWCPDCVAAEKPIEEAVKSSLPSDAVFIECAVGDRASWKDPNSPFRKDPQTRLTNIPTLIELRTPKRLVERELLDPETVEMIFEED